jgi:hypothetical protein
MQSFHIILNIVKHTMFIPLAILFGIILNNNLNYSSQYKFQKLGKMQKIHKYNLLCIIVVAVTALILTGCKHELQSDISINGNLIFHLHTMVDTNTVFQYDSVYIVPGHRKISLSLAQMYISDIQLIKQDGSVFNMNGTILLKTLENEVYQVGNAPNGDYKAIRFSVGLDPVEILKIPLLKSDSLFNKPVMWFGGISQTQGYIFLNLMGKIDTTTNGVGTLAGMKPFSYKIGTNANYKQVVVNNASFTIHPGQSQYVHFMIDYNMLFMGIQLNNPNKLSINSIADNTTTLAKNICNNIPFMFMLDPN